jgi:hypothetical protein
LVEVYLTGAKPETIIGEVVCPGVKIRGAPVVVPPQLNKLLVERIASVSTYSLVSFICYRSDRKVTALLLEQRPDIRRRIKSVISPLRDDIDVDLTVALSRHGLLSEEERLDFVEAVRRAAVEDADDSFIELQSIRDLLDPQEYEDILLEARDAWMNDIGAFVTKLRHDWDNSYSPDDYFDRFREAVDRFAEALGSHVDGRSISRR